MMPDVTASLSPVYLCCGEEPLLVIESADRIRSAAKAAGFGERIVLTASTPGFYWGQLLEFANERSFFSEKRLIDLRMPSGKPGVEGAKILNQYCNALPEDTILLVVTEALGWQERKAMWFKTLTQVGKLIEQKPPAREALPNWIQTRLAQVGLSTEVAGLQWIADHVEGNLIAAHQEIQKLAVLYPQGRLSLQDIRSALSNSARYTVDQLSDALLSGETKRYWQVLDGLRQEGEQLPLVLWRLAEDCRLVAAIRAAVQSGQSMDAAFKAARVFYERRARCQRWLSGRVPIASVIGQLALTDRQIKGLLPGNPWETLQRLPFLFT